MGGSVQRAQRPGRIALYGAASPLCNRDASRHRAAEGPASRPMRVTIAPATPVAILSPHATAPSQAGRVIHTGFRSSTNYGRSTPQHCRTAGACPAPALHLECAESLAGPRPFTRSRLPIPMPCRQTLVSVARRAGRPPGRCCPRIHPGFHCPRCRRALLIRLANGVAP